jgi:hypothetical protein
MAFDRGVTMPAPNANASFACPSWHVYYSDQRGFIFSPNILDVPFLAKLGCQRTSPRIEPRATRAPLRIDDGTKLYITNGFNFGNTFASPDIEKVDHCVVQDDAHAQYNAIETGSFVWQKYAVSSTPAARAASPWTASTSAPPAYTEIRHGARPEGYGSRALPWERIADGHGQLRHDRAHVPEASAGALPQHGWRRKPGRVSNQTGLAEHRTTETSVATTSFPSRSLCNDHQVFQPHCLRRHHKLV